MNIGKKFALALGAVVCLGASVWAAPSIAINRVQQRYPWNGKVDIDYTVSGVDDPSMFHVEFSLARSDGSEVEMRSFTDVGLLLQTPNVKQRVTWESALDGQKFFDTNVTVKATLVADGGNKEGFVWTYLIVDLTGGEKYPVTRIYENVPSSDFNTDEFKTKKLVLRRIEPGTYYMGATPTDRYADSSCGWINKETRHEVTITRPFMLGVFQVTQKQWQLVMGSVPSGLKGYGDTLPVGGLSYEDIRGTSDGCDVTKLGTGVTAGSVDANSFMGLLRAKTGLDGFDLPTEGQWEFACRAGTDVETYTVGGAAKSLDEICWYTDNSGNVPKPVGEKLANDWGFYDMIGNAWDYCRDRVNEGKGYNNQASDDWGSNPVTDPIRTVAGGKCPTRGGAYDGTEKRVRSAIRGGNSATSVRTNVNVGFRVGFMGL